MFFAPAKFLFRLLSPFSEGVCRVVIALSISATCCSSGQAKTSELVALFPMSGFNYTKHIMHCFHLYCQYSLQLIKVHVNHLERCLLSKWFRASNGNIEQTFPLHTVALSSVFFDLCISKEAKRATFLALGFRGQVQGHALKSWPWTQTVMLLISWTEHGNLQLWFWSLGPRPQLLIPISRLISYEWRDFACCFNGCQLFYIFWTGSSWWAYNSVGGGAGY